MSELVFRGIEITDKSWIDEALKASQYRGCEYTFGNNFVWRRVYRVEIAQLMSYYFVRWGMDDGTYKFSFPTGGCDVKTGVELLNTIAKRMISRCIFTQTAPLLSRYKSFIPRFPSAITAMAAIMSISLRTLQS